MTKMSFPPVRPLTKAIREPSGDQVGSKSTEGSVVSWVTLVPSAFISKMFASTPGTVWPNTILDPSGDQRGCERTALLVRIGTTLVPSASITAMDAGPPDGRSTKAILRPSGDQSGSDCEPSDRE